MRKIIGYKQPANAMNKGTQSGPPLQQTAQTNKTCLLKDTSYSSGGGPSPADAPHHPGAS